MKLYQAQNKTWIKLVDDAKAPPGARLTKAREELFFDHLDGMYSFCKDKEGNIVHIPAYQEVDIL